MRETFAVRLALGFSRGALESRRASEAAQALLEAALLESLTAEERAALGLALYGRAVGRGDGEPGDPFAWECALWHSTLPAPPAILLLGGAGTGREAVFLKGLGYTVFAYDPVAAAAEALERHLGAARVGRCTHEETDRWPGPPSVDAVVFGWGSLTHVLDADDRRRVMRAAFERTRGPVLASVWLSAPGQEGTPSGRATRLGRRMGGVMARLRGLSPPPDSLGFASHCGFGHRFTSDELEALGRASGREMRLVAEPYPHVVWTLPR